MRLGVDTNVLVNAHLSGLPRHEQARDFLSARLADPAMTLVVTPLVLHELVHVITDERRFEPAVPMGEALAVARSYLGRANVACLAVDDEATALACELLARHRLGRKRVADALLAATFLRHGVERVVTFDVAGFAPFSPLLASEPG